MKFNKDEYKHIGKFNRVAVEAGLIFGGKEFRLYMDKYEVTPDRNMVVIKIYADNKENAKKYLIHLRGISNTDYYVHFYSGDNEGDLYGRF